MTRTIYQPVRSGRTILRFAAVRWLVAILIPASCLIGGLMLGREVKPAGVVIGMLFALFGCPVFTTFYLYKVLGASSVWVLPLILLDIPGTIVGSLILINRTFTNDHHPGRSQLIITGTYWIAWASILAMMAVTIILAIINGEQWMRNNRDSLPRNKFEAYARSRGSLAARLWISM
jgi:hypothetical protein